MKKPMAIGSVLLLSASLLAGCQFQMGETNDPNEPEVTIKGGKEEAVSMATVKKNIVVKTGDVIPGTELEFGTNLEFAGYVGDGTSIAIRYYEEQQTKTDYFTIWDDQIESLGYKIVFGETEPSTNQIEIIRIEKINE